MNTELIFSSFELDTAQTLLNQIVPQASQINITTMNTISGEDISNDVINQIFVNQNKFKDCYFINSAFSGYAINNSTFMKCSLRNVTFKGSNLKYSDFSGSMLNLTASSSNFDNCDFSNSSIDGYFKNCSFINSYFENTKFSNCTFIESDFSDAYFLNVEFTNIDFTKSSMNNVAFINCSFEDTIFPYFEVLRVSTGLLEIISDNKVIFSPITSNHKINKDKYMEEIISLLPIFTVEKNYVAIANIYIVLGKNREAYNSIIEGLRYACSQKKFGLVRQLCTIASSNNIFLDFQLKAFYNLLDQNIDPKFLSKVEFWRYLDELNFARQKLIDKPLCLDSISIRIKTNFNYTDSEKISYTISKIYEVIDMVEPTVKNSLTIRHNSPPDIVLNISGDFINLLVIFNGLVLVFKGTTAFAEKILTLKEKYNTIKLQDLDKKMKDLQIQELEKNKEKSSIVLADYGDVISTFDSLKNYPKELRKNQIYG